MSLAERLDQIRAGAEKRIPAETRAVMHAAVAAVKDSGVMAAKDAELRTGGMVAVISSVEVPAAACEAIKDLNDVRVDATLQLVLTTPSGGERILDRVGSVANVSPQNVAACL